VLGALGISGGLAQIQLDAQGTLSGNYLLASYAPSTGISTANFGTLPNVSGYTWSITGTGIALDPKQANAEGVFGGFSAAN